MLLFISFKPLVLILLKDKSISLSYLNFEKILRSSTLLWPKMIDYIRIAPIDSTPLFEILILNIFKCFSFENFFNISNPSSSIVFDPK